MESGALCLPRDTAGAMSEENVEIVRRSIAAFEGDEEAWLTAIDPSHVWYPLEEGNIPSHGLDAARAIRKRWLDSWASHRIDVEEILDRGDSVVACLHLQGIGKGSGVEVDQRFYMHWKLREGKMVYLYEYADRAEALEAAGLAE
jgi:ketosteroid isomerase-like protein